MPLVSGLVGESEKDDGLESWLRFVKADYERARTLNLPEPTWLPEATLDHYARMMGFNRHPAPIDPNHVRIRIRRMREIRRMTQAQLAEKVGMSQAAISYIERGWRLITVRRLIAFAKALGVTIEWLVHAPDEDLLD